MKKPIRYLFLTACVILIVLICSACAQTPKGQKIEVDGVKYTFSEFVWNKNTAKALYVSDEDPAVTLSYDAEISVEVLKEATSEKAGEATYTATYGDLTDARTGTLLADSVSLTVYAVNDFHGAVQQDDNHPGLGYMASYLKEKGKDGNTLLIDSGDTWQGSIYSNYNHGELITQVYNYVRFDARTVGNHDFDWGVEPLMRNTALSYNGYSTPVLAANVYDYDFATMKNGSEQQSSIGRKSVVYTLDSGLKVGIVGVIGSEQITSIDSMHTQNICFIDHVKIIKEEAAALRANGCDVVICSIHGGEEDVRGQGLGDYVDLVLCAHTHQLQSSYEGSLLYAQFKSSGEFIGKIDVTYDSKTGKVQSKQKAIGCAEILNADLQMDLSLWTLIKSYNDNCSDAAGQVVANNTYGYFSGSEHMPNLVARAVFDAAVNAGFDVDLAYVNKARDSLNKKIWTYEDLYRVFPFDDMVFIVDVTGSEILDEVGQYNYIYRSPEFTEDKIDRGKTYRIACLDYLFFHTNSSRYYNYFPQSAGAYVAYLDDNYREILRDWLIANGYANGKALDADLYASSLKEYDRTAFHG